MEKKSFKEEWEQLKFYEKNVLLSHYAKVIIGAIGCTLLLLNQFYFK